jgi:hypothetical protein
MNEQFAPSPNPMPEFRKGCYSLRKSHTIETPKKPIKMGNKVVKLMDSFLAKNAEETPQSRLISKVLRGKVPYILRHGYNSYHNNINPIIIETLNP